MFEFVIMLDVCKNKEKAQKKKNIVKENTGMNLLYKRLRREK